MMIFPNQQFLLFSFLFIRLNHFFSSPQKCGCPNAEIRLMYVPKADNPSFLSLPCPGYKNRKIEMKVKLGRGKETFSGTQGIFTLNKTIHVYVLWEKWGQLPA